MNSRYATDVTHHLSGSQEALGKALRDAAFLDAVAGATEVVTNALRAGKKVLIAGNGGSAADAQHLATELMVRFYLDRAPLPSIALGTDAPSTTALGNDLGFEHLFSRQILALGREGDVFIALSTSGQSPNILAACEAARAADARDRVHRIEARANGRSLRNSRPRPERQDSPDTAGLHGGWARPVRDRGTGAGQNSLNDRADNPTWRARLPARAQPVNQRCQLRSLSFEHQM